MCVFFDVIELTDMCVVMIFVSSGSVGFVPLCTNRARKRNTFFILSSHLFNLM